MHQFLIMDYDCKISEKMQSWLKYEREVHTQCALRLQDATRLLSRQGYALVALNLHMSEQISPIGFLEDLRRTSAIPILALGAKSAQERCDAYRLGADICLSEDASEQEIVEAVCALLRRSYVLNWQTRCEKLDIPIRYRDLSIYPALHEVFMGTREIQFTAKEFQILLLLASHPGRVWRSEDIYEHVWNDEFLFDCKSVTDHIYTIRQKLGVPKIATAYIQTVRGVGYRFVP